MEYGVMDFPRPQEKFLYEILYLISKKKKKKLEEGEGERETHPGKKRSVSCEAVITKTCYFFWFDGRSMGISIPPR
jgi:hypothetical protein